MQEELNNPGGVSHMSPSRLSVKESLHLDPEPQSASIAREFLREVLDRGRRLDCLEAAELACSELVTNAILHAHTELEVTVSVSTSVRVEVKDLSPVLPAHRDYDSQATTGRGLALVAAVTDDYGVVEGGVSGKTVWFTIGSESKERSEAEILADWDDNGWDLEEPEVKIATKVVRLEQAPVGLWLAARQHNDALLRELVLYLAHHPGLDVNVEETDRARFLISGVISKGVDETSRHNSLNSTPKFISLTFEVNENLAPAFKSMRKTLDAAEHLARSGALLSEAGRNDVLMVRNWICFQVESQLQGEPPVSWLTFKNAKEEEATHLQENIFSLNDLKEIHDSDEALIASDENNLILSVSKALARMAGYEPEELTDHYLWELSPERLRQTHIMSFASRHLSALNPVVNLPITLPLRRKDGSELICDFKIELAGFKDSHAIFVAKVAPAVVGEGFRRKSLNYSDIFRQIPVPCLVLGLDYKIVDANNAFLESTQRGRASLLGRGYFECFPPDPEAFTSEGVSPIEASLERVKKTKRSEAMGIGTYVTMDPPSADAKAQYWLISHSPILDPYGEVELFVQRAENVTSFAGTSVHLLDASLSEQQRMLQAEGLEFELYTHAQALTEALKAKDEAAKRLTSIAEAAPLIASAQSVDELEKIVIGRALLTLGADGGGILTRNNEGSWVVWGSGRRVGIPRIEGQGRVVEKGTPTHDITRNGQRILLPTMESGYRYNQEALSRLYEETNLHGWVFLPLKANDKIFGSLAVGWLEEYEASEQELELLEALSAQTAQALDRLENARLQALAQEAAQALSETLQRSLLTHPPQSQELSIEVRYQPATSAAEVGGDWYDAFRTLDGSTMIVVGDVSGHDQTAAALMGQLRNLLRGMAFDTHRNPGELLSRLDLAMHGLELNVLASAIMAKVESSSEGKHHISWSNAGHPPPILRSPQGVVTVLEKQSDLLLGLDANTSRALHCNTVEPGSMLVFYTDGLIERRDADLGDGIKQLSRLIESNPSLSSGELADLILTSLVPAEQEDDIALLILKTN